MNIFREVRRVQKKSVFIRIILLLGFCATFMLTTYAWFSAQRDVKFGKLHGDVTEWDLKYFVDDKEILDETVTFTIDSLYPGMPNREDVVHICNKGTASTQIYYELLSVKVFGAEVLNQLKINKDIKKEGTTTHIFSIDKNYPFDVSYTADKNYITGTYIDDETTPNSKATFKFNVGWEYQNGTTMEEITTEDFIDTQFGKDAFNYYEKGNDPDTAIEIKVRITSKMVATSDVKFHLSDIGVRTYGINGQGTAVLDLRNKLEEQGYYIEYVVLKEGEELLPETIWEQGEVITGLSETDTIHIRITNGFKYAEGIATINLLGMFEKYTTEYTTETTEYRDSNGDTAYIPEGFKVGNSSAVNTIDNGLVVEDKEGNQFVWVPVKDVVYNEQTIP